MGGLVLGPVVFHGFEVPERIRFGGRQRLAVHALPGGGRVVEAMGADDRPVEWAGVFSGPSAAVRVRLLERLRRDGGVVPLTWDGWRYSVIIESFEVRAANPAWIPYRLRAVVAGEKEFPGLADAIEAFTAAEGLALAGDEDGLDDRIEEWGFALRSDEVAGVIGVAGELARGVAGRAFLGASRRSAS